MPTPIDNIPLYYILLFSGCVIFSILINSIFLRLARTLGIRNNPEMQIRWSPTVKPALGGISFFVIFLIAFILLEILLPHQEFVFSNRKLLGIFAAVNIAFIMGLADDAFDTKPILKFVTQFGCGLILLLTGTKISCFGSEFLNYSLTILWVIGLMNSINMLDNMDGITSLVSSVILTFAIGYSIINGTALTPLPILALALLGALCGFLVYNWHPSRMFMGDTGSQFLGVFLAMIGIEYCWNITTINEINLPLSSVLKSILVVINVFVIPLTDTTTVVINRLSKGKSPFVGGKDHTTHHLFFNGVTEKRVAILFVLLTGIGCYSAYLISKANVFEWSNALLFAIFPFVTFVSLFSLTHFRVKK